jgi:Domain of Unknown Function with PDB structure (DUF3857)
MRHAIVVLVCTICLPLVGSSQVSELYQSLKTLHPDEPAVFISRSETITILLEKDSLRAFSEKSDDLLILKEQAEVFSNRKVFGSSFNEVKNLSAKTLVWNNGKYKTMEVTDFKKSSDRDQSIFFDDSYNVSFNFPAVASQSRTQLSYTHLLKDVRFMGGFIFPSYLPQRKATFTIKASKGIELFFEVQNDPEGKIKFTKTEKGGFVFYEWTANNLESMKSEEDSPSIQYFAPLIVCYVKSFVSKKGKTNVISSLDDLYKWYFTFIKNLNKNSSPEMKEVILKLQSESKSELDLVKNVFYWVQENIRYIAFEEGMRGLIPHSGNYVCEKRFGDCKDMATLIIHLLQVADIKAYHTWIGTRDIPYLYSKMPTPLVDNHMIATYIGSDGKYYFLDATGNTSFGMPTSMIQGKEALIVFDSIRYEVKTVPIIENHFNSANDSSHR